MPFDVGRQRTYTYEAIRLIAFLPMAENFSDLENKILQDWKDRDVFKKSLDQTQRGERFVFFEGPPTANGKPHMGHVETRAFKDVMLRYKTMRGFFVERKAGWDTQGLPVELEVEKALGISGKKDIESYGVEKFNAKAKESVWKYKDLWEKMTDRVGFWLDTSDPYVTYSNEYIETLWWIFRQAWDQDLLKQDYKVVPYCPRCGTALSSHEVAQGYESVTEPAVYVKFELEDEPGTFVLAWTTTPWTLPGNVALAVDENIEYFKTGPNKDGERYIVAARLADTVFGQDFVHAFEGDGQKYKGAELVGLKYKPLFDFLDLRHISTTPYHKNKGAHGAAYTIVPADFVTTEDGTGVVHTAVMYGEDDFKLGQKLELPKVHTVDEQGKFTPLVKPWVGKEVRDPDGNTQAEIMEWLKQHGKLYKVENYTHDYPFCWRCKHPLLYYAKTSWFILMSKLRDQLIKNNEQVNWYPNHIKDGRFGEWLREVKDWAISRERYWGTPLPIWQCDNIECKHQECLGSYQELVERAPARNRYILVRHGESEINAAGVLNTEPSRKDFSPLTATGRHDVERLAGRLSKEGIDAVFSSEFIRARETADILATRLQLRAETDRRLNEFRIGPKYENRPLAEYHAVFPTSDFTTRFTSAPEGGETWRDVWKRFLGFLKETDARFEGKTILIVSHGDPILVARGMASLLAESQVHALEYPEKAKPYELKFSSALFSGEQGFDPHRPYIDGVTWTCAVCRQGVMRRVPEVADTWFDSGAMPFAQWHFPFENKPRVQAGASYPADYITEAIDQTRGWFYTLLAVATLLQKAKVIKEPPYKNVVVLGHVRDAKGKKLSKSLGNYIDPMELIEDKGADPVRFYLFTMNQPGEPKNFDPKGLDEVIKKTFLILTNVVSFYKLYAGQAAADPDRATHPLDRWIHSLVNRMTADVTDRLDRYDITGAARALASFVTDLSTWYVRRSRDRFKSDEAPMASAVLRHILLKLSKLLAPFTPFFAEQVYRDVGGHLDSVHRESWPQAGLTDDEIMKDMASVRNSVEAGLALRAQAKIKVRQPLQQFVVTATLPESLHDILRDELNVKEVYDDSKLPDGPEWVKSEAAALDISISDELKAEGWLRDLVREFNALRKTAKLQPSDQIIAFVPAGTRAAEVIERYPQELLRDIRAKAVTPSLDGATHRAEIVIDGQASTIGLTAS